MLVVNHVTDGIQSQTYLQGDRIPSINAFRSLFKLSRDTVFAGLRELVAMGIIVSNHGVGYFVASTEVKARQNIFLLFNEFNGFKEVLYHAFMEAVGDLAVVDLYFHNYNRNVFETLVNEARGKYTDYVLMTGKFQGISPLLNSLPGRVFLLDHFHPELKGQFSSVAQNFEKNTYEALRSGLGQIRKYKRIFMVQKEEKEPEERYAGLKTFCSEFRFAHEYIPQITMKPIEAGDLFIVVKDEDLAALIKQAVVQNLVPGTDFGIISYNDTPLKEVLAGGITTLSTDFTLMGKTMAKLISTKMISTIENPWQLNVRKSL